ncbi:MAG: DUF4230 domain-containing protein [Chthoniobacterales bacterium]
MPPLENRPAPSEKRLRWPAAFALVVLILAVLAAFLFYRCETFPGRSLARLQQVGRDASETFVRLAHLQPRVLVNDHVYLEQTTTVAQLAVLQRRVEVEHEMMHSWAGSTKRIKLHGTFVVKAGFDLRKKFSVNVTPKEVLVHLPHAEILSVEEQKVDVLTFENGYWNKISPNDIEHELAALPELARAKSSGLPMEAERAFTRQFREKFHPAQPVRAIFPAPSPTG